jgi:hypothetical protein
MLEKRLNSAIMGGGDWRCHTRNAIPVPVGSQLNSIKIRMAVADAVQNTLAGGLYHVVARHHFTKFDTDSSYIMLDGVYGIGRAAWRRATAGFVHPPVGSRHNIKGPKGKGRGGRQPPGILGPAVVAAAVVPPGVAGPEIPLAYDQSEANGKNAEDNDRHRRLATAYFESNPLGDAMLVRQDYEPFRRYMASKMEIA